MRNRLLITALVLISLGMVGLLWWLTHDESQWLRKARGGDADAAWQLALLYQGLQTGRARPHPDWERAGAFCEQAARAGHLSARAALLRWSLDPEHPAHTPERRRAWVTLLAEGGEPAAAFALYQEFQHTGDSAAAARWLAEALQGGHPEALRVQALARIAESGPAREALDLLARAARAGDAEAAYEAGRLRLASLEPGQRDPEAEQWIIAAASAGLRDAQLEAGRLFIRHPSSANRRQGLVFLTRAWEQGAALAAPLIARIRLLDSEFKQAGHWALVSLAHGHSEALEVLARMTLISRAPAVEPAWGRMWRDLAVAKGVTLPRHLVPDIGPEAMFRVHAYTARMEALLPPQPLAAALAPDAVEAWLAAARDIPDAFTRRHAGWESDYHGALGGSPANMLAVAEALHSRDADELDRDESLFWLRQAAAAGHREAHFLLYQRLSSMPDAQPRDAVVVAYHLQTAARLGVPEAIWQTVQQDLQAGAGGADAASAAALNRRLADVVDGARAALREQAEALLSGRLAAGAGLDLEDERLRARIERLAEEGNLLAIHAMSQFPGLAPEEARHWLERAAEAGHADAMFGLAAALQKETGGDTYTGAASEWLVKAARAGHGEANWVIGSSLMRRRPPDLTRVTGHLRRAAEAGHPEAVNLFSDLSPDNRMRRREPVFDLHYRADTLGDPGALMELSLHYLARGPLHDREAGIEWLSRAAALQHVPACLELAQLYLAGRHVDKDPLRAVRWYEEAARLGDADAAYLAGLIYAQGEVVVRDMQRAREFMDLAAGQGSEPARQFLETFAGDGPGASGDHGWKVAGDRLGDLDPYEVRPFVIHDGRLHEVLEVARGRPVIQIDGRRVPLASDSAVHFLSQPEDVAAPPAAVEGSLTLYSPIVFTPQGVIFSGTRPRIEGTLTPDRDLAGVFALVVIRGFGEQGVHWHGLGDLRKGRPARFTIPLHRSHLLDQVESVLLFSWGREVRAPFRIQPTQTGRANESRFFADRMNYLARHAGETREPEPWKDLPAFLSPDRTGAGALRVRLELTSKGRVAVVELLDAAPAGLAEKILHEAVRLRFYPAMHKGRAIPTELVVELDVY